MLLLPWWPFWLEGAALYAGTLLAWALALYVATRGGLRPVPVLASLATFMLVAYLLGQTVGTLTLEENLHTGVVWFRRTWWGAALAPALWLLLTLALAADEGPEALLPRLRQAFWGAAVVLLGLGLAFTLAGLAGEAVLQWSAAFIADRPFHIGADTSLWHVPPGPWFGAYVAYVLVCLAWAAANLAVLWRSSPPGGPLRARFGCLLVSAILFLLSGAYITIGGGLLTYSVVPGMALLIAAMVLMAWNVARYGALLAGEAITGTGDLLAFSLSMLAVIVMYGGLFLGLAPREQVWLEWGLPLLLLAMATHALADRRSPLIDRLLYGPVAGRLQARLRGLASRVVRQPDPLSALADVRESLDELVREQAPEVDGDVQAPPDAPDRRRPEPGHPLLLAAEPAAGNGAEPDPLLSSREVEAGAPPGPPPAAFRVLVEGALRRLNDLPALSQHPLLAHVPAAARAGGTALERAALLRAELEQAIARLRPAGPRPTPGASAGTSGWLHYLVLYEAYVEGRPNKQIMQRYHLSEGTFHRSRRRAIDAVALDLHQRSASPPPAEAPAVQTAGGPG